MRIVKLVTRLAQEAKRSCRFCRGTGREVNCDEYHAHTTKCTELCHVCLVLDVELKAALEEVEQRV